MLSLFTEEIHEIVQRAAHTEQWQLLIEQTGNKDLLSVKWVPATQLQTIEPVNRALREALLACYPAIDDLSREGLLELRVLACATTDLKLHPRSGKQLRVLDLRVYDAPPLEPV